MTMLSPDFQFSQASLQDYQTCPRRFKLRYLDRLRWPAIESEPVHEAERLIKLGTDFHHLVRQHLDYQQLPLDGVDHEAALSAMVQADSPIAEQLREWWQAYLDHQPTIFSGATIYPEVTFSAPLNGYRLVARFDVLAVQPNGEFIIIDWKTSLKKPPRARLERRVQTKVYPYVIAKAAAALNQNQPINPAAISMLYWYPVQPNSPERFRYSAEQLAEDERSLSRLIEQVQQSLTGSDFPQVDDPRPCDYCIYRSLCNRGDQAGDLVNMEDEAEELLDVTALDWEQIAEIQF